GEQCDGGAYCTASCTFPSLAPGCCQDGSTPGCADASGFSLNFNMHQFCLSLGWATNVPGGVCSQAGTCDFIGFQAVPLCCESNTDGTSSQDDIGGSPYALCHFFTLCEGIPLASYHTAPAATCGPAEPCVPTPSPPPSTPSTTIPCSPSTTIPPQPS